MMNKFLLCFIFFPSAALVAQSKHTQPGNYVALLERSDSLPIVFNIETSLKNGKAVWTIINDKERIEVRDIREYGDSVHVQMPVFESMFRLKKNSDHSFSGKWIKAATNNEIVMPLVIKPGLHRFPPVKVNPLQNISGRWSVTFERPAGGSRPAIAEFKQQGKRLTGTFLTPSGDYRYLEGVVEKDSIMLSTFDGSHAYFFSALIKDGKLINGVYASGPTYIERWEAVKDPKAKLDPDIAAMYVKDGDDELNFRFPDLDSNMVGIRDERFRNKVVVVQLMGSWCPNCMDEIAYMSKYYNDNRERGIEMIALAYEYYSDFSRAKNTISKFRNRFEVKYPMLITGVKTSDSLRTEKTLPQLSPIRAFPTTIFVGRDGKVKEIHPGFNGPGTGEHHEIWKKEFEATVARLLGE